MDTTHRPPSFAFVFNAGLLVLVVLGFGTRAILTPGYWPPVRATLILHIVVSLGWFVFVLFQVGHVQRRDIRRHMAWGKAGVALAFLVFATGVLMIVELNQRAFSWPQVASNGVNIVTFAFFFVAAMAWRTDRNTHMRMITFASLSMMTPAIARALQPIGLEVATHPVWLLLCAVVAGYDWRGHGRVLPATWFGLTVSLCGFAVFGAVAASTATAQVTAAPSATQLDHPAGYVGRIRLVRFLDEPDGYCIDVPGGGNRVLLQMPAIAHTCHFDPLDDQIFTFNERGNGRVVWEGGAEPVCLTADRVEQNAGFQFRNCEDGPQDRLQFDYLDGGALRLAGTELCLSVARTGPSFRETLRDDQDVFGRGVPVNPQFTHLARALELTPCGQGDPSMQRWMAYPERWSKGPKVDDPERQRSHPCSRQT